MTYASVHRLLLSIVLILGLSLSSGAGDLFAHMDSGTPDVALSAGPDVSSGQVEVSKKACDGECVGDARACGTTCVPAGMPSSNAYMDMLQTTLRVFATTCCLLGLNPALDPAPPKARA